MKPALVTGSLAASALAWGLRRLLRQHQSRRAAAGHIRGLQESLPSQGDAAANGSTLLSSNTDQPVTHSGCATANPTGGPSVQCSGSDALLADALPAAARQYSWGAHPHHVHALSHSTLQQSQLLPQEAHPHTAAIAALVQSCAPRNGGRGRSVGSAGKADDAAHKVDSSQVLAVMLPPATPDLPQPVERCSCVMVRTRRQLHSLREHLLKLRVFGVDTEHNHLASYHGITCLIQISDGHCDWLIDTYPVWEWVGVELGPVFSNPSIVKVLHGCANDVLWLQRDFRLYLVNVFDTERAAAALGLRSTSLAYLLQHICGIHQDKGYQRADWRTRPLTPAMQHYARTDAHYLPHLAAQLCERLNTPTATHKDSTRAIQRTAHNSADTAAQGAGFAGARGGADAAAGGGGGASGGCGGDGNDVCASDALRTVLHQSQRLTLQLYRSRSHTEDVLGGTQVLTRRVMSCLGMANGHAHTVTHALSNGTGVPSAATVSLQSHSVNGSNGDLAPAGAEAITGTVQGTATQAGSVHTESPAVTDERADTAAAALQGTEGAGGSHAVTDSASTGNQQSTTGGTLTAVLSAQIEALCCWRDILARAEDCHYERMITDDQLLALILAQPSTDTQVEDVLTLHAHDTDHPHTQQGNGTTHDPDTDTDSDTDSEGSHADTHTAQSRLRHDNNNTSGSGKSRQPLRLLKWLLPWRGRSSKTGDAQKMTQHEKCDAIVRIMQAAKLRAAPGLHLPSPLHTTTGAPAINGAAFTNVQGGRGGGGGGGVRRDGTGFSGVRAGSVLHSWDHDTKRRERVIQKFSSKGQVYQNCKMLSREGQLLCHCDKRKLEWYIAKGLAERVSDDPPTIRLLFEHKNADQAAGEDFYQQSKQNRCVVCGEEGHYLRYRVIPSCYRRQFPVAMKSHRSHDVVLLCIPCHQLAHTAAQSVKELIARDYDIPLFMPPDTTLRSSDLTHGSDLGHHSDLAPDHGIGPNHASDPEQGTDGHESEAETAASSTHTAGQSSSHTHVTEPPTAQQVNQGKRAAAALQKTAGKLPEGRRRELEGAVMRALGRGSADMGVSPEDLEACLLLGTSQKRRHHVLSSLTPDRAQRVRHILEAAESHSASDSATGGHTWHGQQVVSAALSRGGESELDEIVARFRAAFVSICKPRFLPPSWDVQHRARRQYGEHSIFAENRLPPAPVVSVTQRES